MLSSDKTIQSNTLPRNLFARVDIDEFPRRFSPGSRIDELHDPVGTLTARSLRQVDASTSGGRDSHISRDKTVGEEADISVASNTHGITVQLTQDGSQKWSMLRLRHVGFCAMFQSSILLPRHNANVLCKPILGGFRHAISSRVRVEWKRS